MITVKQIGCALVLLLAVGCASYKSTEDIPAVTGFDARLYMGDWYELARLPNSFETNVRESKMSYRITETQILFTQSGIRDDRPNHMTADGKYVDNKKRDVGEFVLRYLYGYRSLHRVIWVSPNYDRAIVTGVDRRSLWIIAREKEIPKAELDKLVKMAADWKFDTSKLEYPQQMK